MSILPGMSLTVGVSQNTHLPYARVNGRLGMFHVNKRIDADSPLLLLLGAAFAAKAVTGKKKKKKPTSVAAASPQAFKF